MYRPKVHFHPCCLSSIEDVVEKKTRLIVQIILLWLGDSMGPPTRECLSIVLGVLASCHFFMNEPIPHSYGNA